MRLYKTKNRKILFTVGLIILLTIISGARTHSINAPDRDTRQEDISIVWETDVDDNFIPLAVDMDIELQEFVYCLSNSYYIDWTLVMAIIEQESAYKEDVISDTKDYGLMQINEINHEWLEKTVGITNFLDAKDNVRAGVYVLRYLFDKYDDPSQVLMAYNLGETGAKRYWENGIYSTSYAESILKRSNEMKKE